MSNLILHGTWPASTFFWGESPTPAARRGRKRRLPPHPYAASPEQLRAALAELAPPGDGSAIPAGTRTTLLPSNPGGPRMPPWLVPPAEEDGAGQLRLAPWKVAGLTLDPLPAFLETPGAWRQLGRVYAGVTERALEIAFADK